MPIINGKEWRLVPVELTVEMMKAAANWVGWHAWKPILDAAPTPPALGDDCDDVDAILRIVGLDPERCRTEGGALNVGRVRTLWEDVVSPAAQASGQAAPSDEEIETLARDYCDDPTVGAIVFTSTRDCVDFARALLSRYGQAPAASAEPYAWMIDGSNRTWFGKFSEIEARAEARRCGGTCTAFPIFRGAQPAASAEPVAWLVDWPDEPELGHYLAEAPADIDSGRSRALVFRDAAPVAAQAPRPCTCHPDDRPRGPCREKYAASECQAAAADGDALDAARYRWLRRPDNPHGPSLVAFCKPDELDAAIDAARQEAK